MNKTSKIKQTDSMSIEKTIEQFSSTTELRMQYCRFLENEKPQDTTPEEYEVPGFSTKIEDEYKEIGVVTFKVSEKFELCVYRQQVEEGQQCKAIFILMHGFKGHMKRSCHIACQLAKAGIEVIGYDQRGFGQSQGTPGYIQSLDQMISDFEEFYQQIVVEKYQYHLSGIPIFLGGLSLGGLLSYKIGLKSPTRFKGIILQAPAISPYPLQSKALYYLAITLGKLLPRFNFIGAGAWNSNRYISAELKIQSDPFQFTQNTPFKSLSCIIKGLYNCKETFPQFKCPFLCVIGDREKVVDPFVAFDLEQMAGSTDKTIMYFKNSWHNLWQESEIYEINQFTIKWILERSD